MADGTVASSGSQSSPLSGSGEQDETDEGGGVLFQFAPAREQADLCLPIANISRIMRRALPANAKVAKEAKEYVQLCIMEFIGFITSEANDHCLQEKRKTISGDDIIFAMTTLGFENYVEPLKVYLHQYRELEGDNRPASGSSERSSADLPRAQVILYGLTKTDVTKLGTHDGSGNGMS